MARIRTLKPEIWADESLGRVPIQARLLYVGLITQADDHGRFRAASALVRGAILPYDSTPMGDVDKWLTALHEHGLVRLYMVRGERFGVFPTWDKHQRVDNAGKAMYPPPDEADEEFAATLREPPQLAAGRESKGVERKGSHTEGSDDQKRVWAAWQECDNLTRHKRWSQPMTKSLAKALGDYELADVCEAIRLYSTILRSEAHYWTHIWTLDEFLARGVGKFAPETQPMVRYLRTDEGSKGPAPVAARPIDRLAAAEAKYREARTSLGLDEREAVEWVGDLFTPELAERAAKAAA